MSDSHAVLQSVEKALVILEALTHVEEIGVTELSREFGLNKATIYRILTTLRKQGYVEQTASEKYRLNFKLFEMGNRMVNQIGIRKTVRPYLEQVAAATRETVNLAVLEHYSVIYIDRIESREPLRIGLDIGARFPAHCTALGLVILAYLNPLEVDALLVAAERDETITKYTENSLSTFTDIKNDLKVVRDQGYSIDNGYYLQGIRAIGAPIFNHTGRIRASISIAAPAIRLTDSVLSEFIPLIKEAARNISLKLGCPENLLPAAFE
ncbi:MAG: kdgR 2 [Firmicutes bacterium]|nr:kdgR 2 [Bacillota bacterium]